MTAANQRQTGSFYTERKIAERVANWAIRAAEDCVLEPSFGDGVFVEQSLCRFDELGSRSPNIAAVEILPEVADSFCTQFQTESLRIVTADFLSLEFDNQFDVVIGNPPYVGLKNLPAEQHLAARKIIETHHAQCPNNGSLWFPFVLHAITAMRTKGRLAFVLPFEITYTRYALGLWRTLSKNFSNLFICRIYEDFFPTVDVETLLLFAEDKGGETDCVRYNIYHTVDDFFENRVAQSQQIAVSDLIGGKKPFVSAMLTGVHRQMLRDLRERDILAPLLTSCKFKIGYVSAGKHYFHPDRETAAQYSIPTENLRPVILNAKEINDGTGIGIEVKSGDCPSYLYLPQQITEGDKQYIHSGEMDGVHQRYKCKQRKPWYITPNVEVPDVVLSVFGEIPKLVANKGNYAVSNSLLCGVLKSGSAEQLLCRWYNSLTLLSLELAVHSLGGGSFVIIPGEADQLELVKDIHPGEVTKIYRRLNDAVKQSGIEAAYILGDQLVLQEIFGLPEATLHTIREAIRILRSWRNPRKRRMQNVGL